MEMDVAMYKYARQSKENVLHPAGRAVDGRRVVSPTTGFNTNCAFIRGDGNPAWWMLDLSSAYEVNKVSILTANFGQCTLANVQVCG